MDWARQILRYSAPAGIMAALLLGFQLLFDVAVYGRAPLQLALAAQPVIALIALAATLPVGFLLSQFYRVEFTPVSRATGYVRRDRGGAILLRLSDSDRAAIEQAMTCSLDLSDRTIPSISYLPPWIPLARKGIPEPWRLRFSRRKGRAGRLVAPIELADLATQREYADQWGRHWEVVQGLLDISSMAGFPELKREYTNLSDLYHALGAARLAVCAAWMGFVFVNIGLASYREDFINHLAAPMICTSVITAFSIGLWLLLHQARGNTSATLVARVAFGLHWLISYRKILA